jgi:hypothetical protein
VPVTMSSHAALAPKSKFVMLLVPLVAAVTGVRCLAAGERMESHRLRTRTRSCALRHFRRRMLRLSVYVAKVAVMSGLQH